MKRRSRADLYLPLMAAPAPIERHVVTSTPQRRDIAVELLAGGCVLLRLPGGCEVWRAAQILKRST
jgi:hypothetical protein